VQHHLAAGEWRGYRRRGRQSKLAGELTWLRERLIRHHGNADVVRQDLQRERGIAVSLRTLERAVAPFRAELAAEARATLRFETPPGRQLQIDFGQRRVSLGGAMVPVFLFVATLGYSRLLYVQAFRHERQSAWFAGLEAAFRHFGGVPHEVLLDNARALVDHHDPATREVRFNARLVAFARYWDITPRACAPYRARTIAFGDPSAKQPAAPPPEGARTKAASNMSSATRWPATASTVGRRWRRIWRGGCARSPRCAGMARRRRPRAPALIATRRRCCAR
jgi:hypothetical protein